MKKKIIPVALATIMLSSIFSGCAPQVKDETAPVIAGNKVTVSCQAGETLNLLTGVTATDETDGDITSSITVSVMPTLTVTDGSVTPQAGQDGEYEVTYTVKDAAGNEQKAFSTLVVTPALAPSVLYKEYSFNAASECPFTTYFNEAVQGTASVEKGNYRIKATQVDGEAWHIKYEGNIATVAGAEYEITYNFISDVAGKVKFGGEKEYDIVVGSNTVKGKFVGTGENVYTELQLGMLSVFTIDITSVTVTQTIGEDVWKTLESGKALNEDGVVSGVFDNNSEGSVSATADSATINITKGSDENGCWQTRLVVAPGVDLEPGKYEISVDIQAEKDIEMFEMMLNNGDVEKGIGCLYGQSAEAGVKKTITWSGLVEGNKDNLTLIFQLGQQKVKGEGNVFTMSNLTIRKTAEEDEVIAEAAETAENDFWSDSQGTSVREQDGSVTLTVEKGTTTPNVWELKQKMWTTKDLEAGRTYVVSVDVTSTVALPEFEALLRPNDGGETNVGGAWGVTTEANVTKNISFEVTPSEAFDNVGLVFQLGKLQEAATVKFENFSIVAKGGVKNVESTTYVFTPEGFGTYNDLAGGGAGNLYVSDGVLVYEMTSIGLTDWHNKMYIEKLTLEEDKIYTFEFEAKADKAISCAWFLNVFGKWDPRLSEQVDFTTEWQTFSFKTTAKFAAEMNFEVLWQFGSEENSKLGGAKIEFRSLKVYSQDAQ